MQILIACFDYGYGVMLDLFKPGYSQHYMYNVTLILTYLVTYKLA